jgi:hypothetical protein
MLGTYASAALVCAAALLTGRAVLAICGRHEWSWLEPAVGLAALFAVAGPLARAPGHSTTVTVGLLLLLALSFVALRQRWAGNGAMGAETGRIPLSEGLAVAAVAAAVTAIPFAVAGRFGLIGVGFNNDLGLHLAWTEWLRDGLGPTPDDGYPLGPHGVAATLSAIFGIELGQAFTGILVAITVLAALTALAALTELRPAPRLLAATLVAMPYLGASYFAQSAFKETAEALFVLAFAIALPSAWPLPAGGRERLRAVAPLLVLCAGIVFSYSFAGLAWPIAAVGVWALTFPAVRAALRPRRLLGALARPATLAAMAALGAAALVLGFVGPFGFAESFGTVQAANTYGPASPAEALGFWATANYRLNAPGEAPLAPLTTAVGLLALLLGLAWWLRRREAAVPAALAGGVVIYLLTLPLSGDYARAKALIIIAPLVMLIATRALLSPVAPTLRIPARAWTALAVVFCAGAAASSFLVLRDAPVAPPGHGSELRAFLPEVSGQSVLYAGQDRFAAYELRGADVSVPVVEFPDADVEQRPTKPFDTGAAYSPIDFDSFTAVTLDRFDYVVTSRAAYSSRAPSNFRAVGATASYLLWKRTGPTPRDRHTLLEGGEAAAPVDCTRPEMRVFVSHRGVAAVMPRPVIGRKSSWSEGDEVGLGESTSQTLRLGSGRWRLSLQYFSPEDLRVRGPGLDESLPAALDGQRPNTISLFNDGQYWPVGEVEVGRPGRYRFTISVAEPNALQELTSYNGQAELGELVATRAGEERILPLPLACDSWLDFYKGGALP